MLRSSNPILSKRDAFTPAAPQYGQAQYGQGQYREALSGYQQVPPPGPVQAPEGRMTFDDVVTKTAVTMAVLILTAAAAGISGADHEAVHAARALGMSEGQVVSQVEWPLALPLVISGLRSASSSCRLRSARAAGIWLVALG